MNFPTFDLNSPFVFISTKEYCKFAITYGFLGQSPKQREEEGWGHRGRETTPALT